MWCNSMPMNSAKERNSALLKGAPLSLLKTRGIPFAEKILSNLGMVDFAEVDLDISTNGKREYSAMTTNMYSPEGDWDAGSSEGIMGSPEMMYNRCLASHATSNKRFHIFIYVCEP